MSVQFIETLTMDIEGITRAPARHKLWAWVVKALAGPKAPPFGPYHYLVSKVDQYDIAALYLEVARVVDTPTILSHSDDMEALFHIAYRQGCLSWRYKQGCQTCT